MITYNKYIDKIGIEFEGYWNIMLYEDIMDAFPYLREHHSDSSLQSFIPGMIDQEITTEPLNEHDINQVFFYMKRLEKQGGYKISEDVGLHFHISFKKNVYGALCTEEFYTYYLKEFSSWFPLVYANRRRNHYCRASLDNYDEGESGFVKKDHFKRQSRYRYHFINYQIRELQTIEVRGYGGKYATIGGLEECIQKTISCIPYFLKEFKENETKTLIQADDKPSQKRKEVKEIESYWSIFDEYGARFTGMASLSEPFDIGRERTRI